jgi:hypothetical protein
VPKGHRRSGWSRTRAAQLLAFSKQGVQCTGAGSPSDYSMVEPRSRWPGVRMSAVWENKSWSWGTLWNSASRMVRRDCPVGVRFDVGHGPGELGDELVEAGGAGLGQHVGL